jgi:LemA protein
MIDWYGIGLLLATLFYAVVVYNRLVRDRQFARAGWSDIGVQLKRRHDLIPRLVDAVAQYTAHEQATLEQLAGLRSRAANLQPARQQAAVENDISQGLGSILALQEAYPELRANPSFLQLQNDISSVEADIQYARRYYNGAVRNLNTRVESFPDLLLARLLGFHAAEYFEFEDSRPA